MEIPRPPKSPEAMRAKEVAMDDIKPRSRHGGVRDFFTRSTGARHFGGRTGRAAKKTTPAEEFQNEGRRSLPRGVVWGMAGLVIFFIGGCAVLFYSARLNAVRIVSTRIGSLEAGAQDLQNFDLKDAAREFSASNEGLSLDLKNAAGAFGFLFEHGGPFHSFVDISNNLSSLSDELNGLESSFFDFCSTRNGGNLVAELADIRGTLHAIDAESGGISGALTLAGSAMPAGTDLLSLRTKMENTENFLDAFVPWLQASAPHHVLVLFQNPSEIRPAGGFLGSYADVTLQGGNITDIAVHDVADVDMTFKENIVPPLPLQAEVSRFRPADANWFFDFADSASETVSFFERSGLYAASSSDSGTANGVPSRISPSEILQNKISGGLQSKIPAGGGETFDAVIAVSPKVISDLLSLTGPISVSSTRTVFDAATFLVQIQKIVQNGQATGATYPKSVLKELMEAMTQKIAALSDTQKQALIPMATDWINGKDVMFYAKNPAFENFFEQYNAAGTVAVLPQDFEGDYLAVVDANIVGQKSDLYIAQNVDLESQINADGTVSDNVIISRKHNGNQSPYWWYRAPNQDYLQLFVPDGSTLSNESGGFAKNIAPPVAYAKMGYSTDPMVSALSSTQKNIFGYPVSSHEESGKEVFATWARVMAGNTTTVSFDYSHRLFLPPADGMSYQFIFEKQAGTARHYRFDIMAPIGFRFAENNLPTYEYESADPPGRLVINLTLKKI